MQAKIFVTLKKGVHDPQGEAVRHAIDAMGHKEIKGIRVGKFIEVDLADMDQGAAEAKLTEVCEKLLANTVIESYNFELT